MPLPHIQVWVRYTKEIDIVTIDFYRIPTIARIVERVTRVRRGGIRG